MASDAQIRANRENARRSSGPRTSAGKRQASENSTKHGLAGEVPVLPGEDRAAYDQLHSALSDELEPHGVLEGGLVAIVSDGLWRLSRARRIESEVLTGSTFGGEDRLAGTGSRVGVPGEATRYCNSSSVRRAAVSSRVQATTRAREARGRKEPEPPWIRRRPRAA